MPCETPRILVVEDEQDIAELVSLHLRSLGNQVEHVSDGLVALTRAASGEFDLVLLDLNLPRLDGMEICRRLRADGVTTPILMLTSRTSELDRVLGLEVGADDYLVKPFSIRELMARVKAQLRRQQLLTQPTPAPRSEMLRFGELVIDVAKRVVKLANKRVELTAKEFDLLLYFAQSPGIVHTRAQLLDQVWGYGFEGYEHTVNSHINRLRAKIEQDAAKPTYIRTVWGVGYRFGDGEGE